MPHLSPRARGLAALLVLALLVPLLSIAVVAAAPSPAAAATPVALTVEEQSHLDLLNQYRRDRGLPALAVDARVQLDARRWARTMADRNTLAHDPALGDACAAASSTCAGWAENVGQAGGHARVLELFAASPGHARNMASTGGDTPIRVGIGVFRDGARTWVVQRFMRCHCQNDGLADQLNRERRHALAFARAVHQDFLGTTGSAASLDTVAAPLAYGVDRRSLVDGIAYSDAWVGAMVDRYYRATLGRRPDAAGRAFWVDLIRSGASPAEVAAHFFASDEYYGDVGGNPEAWVRALYEQLLGRTGDGDGVEHWAALLRRGTTREAVAMTFYQSAESRGVRVADLYELLLARRPDDRGLIHWIFRLADGQDVRLAVNLAGSDEYLVRAVQRFG